MTAGLVEALKKLLKTRGITYRDLARALDLSEPSIKRLFSERTFTLQRLEQVCGALDIDFFEIAKLARGATVSVDEMTVEQEKALASDSKLLGVFYLLFNDWQPADILERYVLTKAETLKLVLRLERLGLVELLPGDKVKLTVPKTLRLRRDGPIRRAHGKSVVATLVTPLQRICFNRNVRILIICKKADNAVKRLRRIRKQLESNPRIVADFGGSSATPQRLTFSYYGVQEAIPTSFLLPCYGSGAVVFSPEPTSPTAKSFTVTVNFVGQP